MRTMLMMQTLFLLATLFSRRNRKIPQRANHKHANQLDTVLDTDPQRP